MGIGDDLTQPLGSRGIAQDPVRYHRKILAMKVTRTDDGIGIDTIARAVAHVAVVIMRKVAVQKADIDAHQEVQVEAPVTQYRQTFVIAADVVEHPFAIQKADRREEIAGRHLRQ
ncbi:hypothetical protein C9E81_05275 [Paracoccus alkanivorans]|uniref:Uncharacterized protein n=1 Tax=Paracoccus alkanivorans TaxID=2116655 RepID=A0A3M0MXM5_9RHOB|nr:hypothetical protein C9E81_05275 [Paracoccus alkanivorans]